MSLNQLLNPEEQPREDTPGREPIPNNPWPNKEPLPQNDPVPTEIPKREPIIYKPVVF